MGGVGLDLGEQRGETCLIEYNSCLDCCVGIIPRPGHGQRRKGWLIEAKRLLIQDDSSRSLPALIANSVTAWKLTVCLSLNMTVTTMTAMTIMIWYHSAIY